MSKNGALGLKKHYNPLFMELMNWNSNYSTFYGGLSETNLKYSWAFAEETVMMDILYCYHLLTQVSTLQIGPATAPARYCNGLTTDDSFMIEEYKRDIQFFTEQCEHRIKYTKDNIKIRPINYIDIQ